MLCETAHVDGAQANELQVGRLFFRCRNHDTAHNTIDNCPRCFYLWGKCLAKPLLKCLEQRITDRSVVSLFYTVSIVSFAKALQDGDENVEFPELSDSSANHLH